MIKETTETQKLSYEELLAQLPTRSDNPQEYEEKIKNALPNSLPVLDHTYLVGDVSYREIFINANPTLGILMRAPLVAR